jgi:GR25 family glycosyltransferase involved in LPS biosynthesis
MSARGFVIHLLRATQRRANVDRLLAASPVPTEVFAAVDGRAISEAEVAKVYSTAPLMTPRYPFRIGRGEIACFLSHRTIWQRMQDEGIAQALILEDDVALDDGFARAFSVAARFAGTEGFVQFQTRPVKGPSRMVAEEHGLRIVAPKIVPRRTSAQLVGINAARRLLAATECFDRPIDGVLQLRWETQQPIHCVEPSAVHDLTEEVGGTTAQSGPNDTVVIKLNRAWHRASYRLAVARRSRQDP